MSVAFFLLTCAGLACRDEPTTPRAHLSNQASTKATSQLQTFDGCTHLRIRADPGPTQVLVDSLGAGCGGLVPVLDTAAVQFNATTGIVQIPLRLYNGTGSPIESPVRLRFFRDSVQRALSDGTPVSGTGNLSAPGDSVSADGTIDFWFYDDSLAPAWRNPVLRDGARSEVRWLGVHAADWSYAHSIVIAARGEESEVFAVPMVASSSRPVVLWDSLGTTIDNSPGMPANVRFHRQILVVAFHEGTSQQQRDQAIDSVRGRIVGGRHTGVPEAYYYVFLPHATTAEPFRTARMTLSSLPQVAIAALHSIDPMDSASYLSPRDGPGEWRTWKVNPDSALGANWALEAIGAPLAWGCSVGDTLSTIGMADDGIHLDVPDLTGNIAATKSVAWPDPSTEDHGIRVASIVAAAGNNDTGMTGAMWRARLHLRDRSVDADSGPSAQPDPSLENLEMHLAKLGLGGARIINLSRNTKPSSRSITNPDSTNPDHRAVFVEATCLWSGLLRLSAIPAGFRSS